MLKTAPGCLNSITFNSVLDNPVQFSLTVNRKALDYSNLSSLENPPSKMSPLVPYTHNESFRSTRLNSDEVKKLSLQVVIRRYPKSLTDLMHVRIIHLPAPVAGIILKTILD